MNIIASNSQDKKEIFRMTHAVKAGKVIDLAGQEINIKTWVLYDDSDEDGKEKTVLTMVLETGEIVGTISKTFIKEFQDIIDVLGEIPTILVETSETKGGRTFVFPVPV